MLDHMRDVCKSLYVPDMNISIDERMIRSKHRSGMRQFIKNTPCRFGIKIWIILESKSGYTYDIKIYNGARERPSPYGLGYDVVCSLISTILGQG